MTELTDAEVYYKKGQYQKAAKVYKDLLEKNPKDALVYQELGRCLLRTDQIDEAYSASMKVLELNQELTIPLITIGSVYVLKKQLDDAEQILQDALKLDPNQEEAYDVLSAVYTRQGRMQESISASRRAIELKPKSWTAHYNLGVTYTREMSQREAHKEFWNAFKLSPSSKTANALLVENISIYGHWYTIILTILSLAAFIIHSIVAWPLAILPVGFCFIASYAFLRTKKYKMATSSILLGIFIVLLFLFLMYKLPPIFR